MTIGTDPVSALRDQLRMLGVSVAVWESRASVTATAAERKAASGAVGAIDAMLPELYLLQGAADSA